MRHIEGRFEGTGGLGLYCQQWLPDGSPRLVVVLVHGAGEHSGRYMNVVRPLAEAGYAVCSYDHRGHGLSPGPRVHIDAWSEYREDLTTYISLVAQRLPGLPLVLYGHSMGSLVVLDYLLETPTGLAGAIISGVATEPAGVGSPIAIVAAKVLSGVLPRCSVDLGIAPESLTRDPVALEAFRVDPLVTGRATVRWGAESLKAVARVKAGQGGIDLPLLVLHGEADPLNRVDGARALFEAARNRDKTKRIYPGVVHEPHNDLGHETVAYDVREWLGHLEGSFAE